MLIFYIDLQLKYSFLVKPVLLLVISGNKQNFIMMIQTCFLQAVLVLEK